jgi:fructose-1,6-bisphosphatase/inositol monophosphatase family enzyme
MDSESRERLFAAAAPTFDLAPIPRCAAEHYPRLCLGEYDIALFQRTLPWDHAAGILFLIEAGGCASRWDGKEYHPCDGGTGLIASATFDGLEQALTILQPALGRR